MEHKVCELFLVAFLQVISEDEAGMPRGNKKPKVNTEHGASKGWV